MVSFDAFWDLKQRGIAWKRPDFYVDLVLPKNSFVGAFIGGTAFVFGFAMIWHIWWLAAASLVLIAAAIIVRG